jgi:hypothetical protein
MSAVPSSSGASSGCFTVSQSVTTSAGSEELMILISFR